MMSYHATVGMVCFTRLSSVNNGAKSVLKFAFDSINKKLSISNWQGISEISREFVVDWHDNKYRSFPMYA